MNFYCSVFLRANIEKRFSMHMQRILFSYLKDIKLNLLLKLMVNLYLLIIHYIFVHYV